MGGWRRPACPAKVPMREVGRLMLQQIALMEMLQHGEYTAVCTTTP